MADKVIMGGYELESTEFESRSVTAEQLVEFFAYETVGMAVGHVAPVVDVECERFHLQMSQETAKTFWEHVNIIADYVRLYRTPGTEKHWEVAWLLALVELGYEKIPGTLGEALWLYSRVIPIGIPTTEQFPSLCVDNPPPDYGFEPSYVYRSADRIAFDK